MENNRDRMNPIDIDLTIAGQFVSHLAREGGQKLVELSKRRNELKTHSKGGVDFATEADDALDKILMDELMKQYPDIPVLSEESAPKDYSEYKEKPLLWVVDPLDGTTNFKHGFADYGIGIGLVSFGKPRLGICYIPSTDSLYYAQEGKESTLNGEPIKTSQTTDLKQALLCTDWGWDPKDRLTLTKWLPAIAPKVRAIQSRGSAVATISAVADGRVDIYLQPGLKPWDMAAPSIIVQQAGGIVTAPDGSDWDIFNSNFLAANNKTLHAEILSLLSNIK